MDTGTHLLEGDGIVSNLFYYIWKIKASGTAPKCIADLCIPSTVVLEHNFPKAWYYNAEGDIHDVERKLGRDVDTHLIQRQFSEKESNDCDIVATYYASIDINGAPATRVEFLDSEALHDFLLRRTRRPDGFVQRWVQCSSPHNTVILAVWSPHLCVIRKRQNNHPMRDHRVSMFDRGVTYEGPTRLSNDVFVAPHVTHQVEAVCQALVKMLHTQHRICVQRIVLHFKVDSGSNLWLLFCSSMRVAEKSQVNLAPTYVRYGSDDTLAANQHDYELTQRLRDDAYEFRGASRSTVPILRLSRAQADHPLNVMHPRPPSMGPIGNMYDSPRFAARARELAVLKSQGMLGSPRKPRPDVSPRRNGELIPKPPVPRQPTRPRTKPRVAVPSATNQPAPTLTTLDFTTNDESKPKVRDPKLSRTCRLFWLVLRVAVVSGNFSRCMRRVAIREWCETFLYSIYSHFTCTSRVMSVTIPRDIADVLPQDWLSRLGLSTSVSPSGQIAIAACGKPLLLMQSALRQITHEACNRLDAAFAAVRWQLRMARASVHS